MCNIDPGMTQYLPKLLSQASPIYPFQAANDPSHPASEMSWINEDKIFTNWLTRKDSSNLQVHGISNISRVGEYIFQHLDSLIVSSTDHPILYFEFKQSDARFNTLNSMLSTFLAQIISHYPKLNDMAVQNIKLLLLHRSWTTKDLYAFFECLRATRQICGLTYVINRLDLCIEPFDWFLKELSSIHTCSESRFKAVIISKRTQQILDVPFQSLSINVDDHDENDKPNSDALLSTVHFGLDVLFQEHPQYCRFELTLAEVFSECGQDIHLCQLIVDWLRFGEHSTAILSIEKILQTLSPPSPKKVLETIMASIGLERQKWARTLVALALCSFRPLTILELGTTLAFDVDLEEKEPTRIISPNLLTELRQIFGSLFIARNSEIYFSHPSAHDFFIPPDLDTSKALPWFKFEGEGVAHAEIACFCLFYISLQAVQKEAAGTSSRHRNFLQSSISDSRNDLLSYATRYWPDHYKRALSLSPESESTNLTTQAVTKFFGDPETVFFWAKSYYDILNPFTRPEKPLSSILPIISSLNLLDFVQITSMHPYSDELDNHQSALLEAVRGDSFDTLRLLLESFSPSHSTLQDAIKVAASCAESRSLILLLDYVSKSKERLEWQQHLLFRAAGLGWDSVVKLLVESGVELNPPAVCSGLSPLHLAVRNNHIGVTKILLEGNASLTSQTLSGMNALHYACKYGRPDILRLIIQGKPDLEVVQAKPDLEINHKDQWSSLQLACYQGHHQIVELLLGSGADINYSEEKTPPLVIATQNGHIKCCRILLQHGANVKTKSEFHSPILMLAVQTENIDIINLLLDCEAEINEEDLSTIRSSTALSCAAAKGLKDIVSCLIKRNANVNRPEDVVERPVYVAAREGHHEVVELLIDAGAVMNIFNHSGWSPLHTAYDHPEVAHILLKKGADLNRASHDGTPLHLASKWNYPEVVKVYLQYKPDLEIKIETNDYYHGMAALCIATAQGNTEIVRMLLEHGAKPDQQSPKGEFPLLYALCLSSNRESEDITEALLDYNASLSMRNDYGDTALHYIRSHTPVSVVKLIVNAGADLEISNKLGITPICSAVKYGNVDVMKYLFSKGAQIDIVGGYWSGGPLHIACFLGLLEIIKFLIEKKANVNLENSGVAGTPLISACSSQIDDSELVDRKCETEQEIFDPDTAKYDYQDLDRPHTVNNPNVEIATNRQEGTRKQIIRYLIEEARAEVNLGSGAFGYPLHAACLQSTSEIVKFLLDHGARVDVEDYLGHKPIHFAAFHTLSTFDLILGSTQYASMKDKLGRIPLHYAVVSGRVELVKRVLDLSLEFVNASDCDEWTPLLWATRTCGRWRTTVEKQPEIIKLLLDAGADLWVRAKGLDREWSPLKVARYYGADDKVTDLLVPKSRKRVRNGVEEIWDEKFHLSRKAAKKSKILCDGCLHVSHFIFLYSSRGFVSLYPWCL